MVPACSLKVPRASSYSGSRLLPLPFAYTTLTSYGRSFQYRSARLGLALCGPKPHGARTMVWALPRSLAATYGIILIFSSSGYLDVSVHRVPSVYLLIQYTVTGCTSRVSPFRYLRIPACLRLPVAFRSLSRLSSALSAKASTLRPFLLNLRSAAFLRPGSQDALCLWRFIYKGPFGRRPGSFRLPFPPPRQLRQEAGLYMISHVLCLLS